MNPLLWLEMRLRMSERRLWIIASFFLFAMGVAAAVVLLSFAFTQMLDKGEPSVVGMGMGIGSLLFQAGLLCLLAPLATAGRLSMEREQRTLPALINSPVPRRTIAAGKIQGAWLFTAWLALLTFPFVMMGGLWGGFPLPVILLALLVNLLCGLALCTLAMGFSGLFGRSLMAYLAMGAFLFAWMAVLPLLGAILMIPVEVRSHLGGDAGAKVLSETIGFITFYHNPFVLLVQLFSLENEPALLDYVKLAYAPVVWALMGWAGYGMAARSLKRDVA